MDKCNNVMIADLDNELFIEELGNVEGGGGNRTTLAIGEEGGSTPSTMAGCEEGPLPGWDFGRIVDDVLQRIPSPSRPTPPLGPLTTLALGEEA